MQRVLIASYLFPPSTEVGARRVGRLARLLPDFGCEVDVICAAPGASTKSDAGADDEVPTNGRIQRVPTPFVFGRDPEQHPIAGAFWQTAWWKARAYLEWAVLTAEWSWQWGEAAVRQVDLGRNYDVIVVDAPPRAAVVPFIRLAARQRIPVVLDLRDHWLPDVGPTPIRWHPAPEERRRRWISSLAGEAIGGACRVVLCSEDLQQVMRRRFPSRPPQDFSYVPNAYASVDEVAASGVRSPEQPLRIVYTGSLAYGRHAHAISLVKAMGLLRRKHGTGVVQFIVAGSGGQLLLETIQSEGVADDVEVHGWIAEDEAIQLQRGADALLLIQPFERAPRVSIPAKLFEYMARRRHILGMVGPGPSARLIEEHDLGMVVGTVDPSSIARALEVLDSRIRQAPVLPHPPEAFSEDRTVASFADVLNGIREDSSSHSTHVV